MRFLTNHARVLLLLAEHPDLLLREAATRLELTERATQRIVRELRAGAYLQIEKIGRRNRYVICPALELEDPRAADVSAGALLHWMAESETGRSARLPRDSCTRGNGLDASGGPLATRVRRESG